MKTILNLTAWNGTMETSDKDLDSKNPMGLVKFMFRIRMLFIYDTPYKSLFEFDYHLVMGVSIWTKQGTGT
jgi:hypothetical protein